MLSSDNCTPQIKYDVFVSFRGEDIRDGFLSHLIADFERKKINAFVDDQLERGDEVWSALVGAIKGSSISLIIFSKDYASSHWCLEELVTILECRDKYGQILIPVFYKVEPTDVRHQSFAKHQSKYETNKVQIWRESLEKSTELTGIASSKYPIDAELVKEIVKVVLKKLAKPSVNLNRLVGIEEKIATVESLMGKEPEATRLIGIWGRGGIGKTTLVEEVFQKVKFKYDASCFLDDVRDQSNKHGIIPLKKSIFSKLLGHDVDIDTPNSLPEDIVRRIGGMKVLIVLDNVNDSEHLEKLLGSPDNFESGSRIIVSTRNKQVLKANKFDEEYQLRELSFDEALQFFNLKVFNQSDHQREYKELSERVVNYAKGVPLVVRVLAARLRGNEKEVWESELDKLKKMPLKEVSEVLEWSYNDLDRKEQEVFLDLACFFLRLRKSVNVASIKSLLKDGESDNSVAVVLKRLEDRALITISNDLSLHQRDMKIIQRKSSEDNVLMHDSVQEMAWDIVRRESSRPGSHSRLWDPDDVYEALKDNKGNASIRSIQIQLSTIKKQKFSPQIFAKMSTLQFLVVSGNYTDDHHQHFAEGLQLLATELKFLYWDCYPLKSLPENFSTEKLVILSLQIGRMEKLWDGVKNLVNLRELDLSNSWELKELPDLSKATNLEVLSLNYCRKVKALPSFEHQAKLKILYLSNCGKLQAIPELPLLLKTLDVHNCISLQTLPEFPMSLETLDVSCCHSLQTLPEFPMSLKIRTKSWQSLLLPEFPMFLKTLDLRHCRSLQTLPELPLSVEILEIEYCFSLLTLPKLPPSLKTLKAEGCRSLKTLPELPLSFEILEIEFCTSLLTLPKLPPSLKTLKAKGCQSLQTLPELPQFLKTLDVSGCKSLQTLPKLPLSLETLDVRVCKSLQKLQNLPLSLEDLDVTGCKSLQILVEFPQSLQTLQAVHCEFLQTLPTLPHSLKRLYLCGCKSLQTLPELPLSLEILDVTGCESLQIFVEFPQSLKTLRAKKCESLQTLPKLPHSVEFLDLDGCKSLQTLPKLPHSLKSLYLCGCKSLQTLPEAPLSLESLNVTGCESLQTLPKLPHSLKFLDLYGCNSLQTLPELPLSLEILDVTGCKSLQIFVEFPQSLKTLRAKKCESLQKLQNLPLSLEILDVTGCESLQILVEFPQYLKSLVAKECKSLQTLPKLPQSLEALHLYGCNSLQTLPELPLSLEILDVTGCKSLQILVEFPQSLKTLRAKKCESLQTLPKLPLSLEFLYLDGCKSLQTLPELPLSLKELDVSGCISIQNLPKLPVSLKSLKADDCESLKTVLFPSTTVEQLKENGKILMFRNCLNLDEHLLLAMGLNARIDMMKLANHLSSPNHYYNNKYLSYKVIYPGSSIIEWLENKTTKDYLIIDWSSPSFSPILGFIFCFILDKCQDTEMDRLLLVYLIISDVDGDGQKDSFPMLIDIGRGTIESDHVCMIYDKRWSDMLRAKIRSKRFKIQVRSNRPLKGFGVSPITTSAYKSFITTFIKQIELGCSSYHSGLLLKYIM